MYLPISEAFIGKHFKELPTPCLCLDLDVMDFNTKAMNDFVKGTPVKYRPHFKAHKSLALAHIQINGGAIGMTCAKLGEAEVLARGGIKSVLLANQTIGKDKIQVLCGLNRYSEVITAIDAISNADEISKIACEMKVVVPAVIEVDSGLHRSGVRSIEEAVALAQHIHRLPGLKFKGIQAYEGAFRGMSDEQKRQKCDGEADIPGIVFAIKARQAIEAAGFPVEIVSVSSTGTMAHAIHKKGITEVQPGSYLVMETAYYANNVTFPFKEALFIPTTVCSTYKATKRIVTDCGKKGCPYDQGLPTLIDDRKATLALHEEHCLIDATEKLSDCKVGDVLTLAPAHCCTTFNQYDFFFGVRNGYVEAVFSIDGRGKYE